MTIKTVKVELPQNYKTMRYMNAGMARELDSYYRAEEAKQTRHIAEGLYEQSKDLDLTEAVKEVWPVIMNSDNTESIKQKVLEKFIKLKMQQGA